jgi:hypothetical protein
VSVLQDRRFTNAAIVVFVIYLATLAISPKRVFWMPDEGAKFLEMHSIEIKGDLRYSVDFPSRRIDTEFRYLPHRTVYPRPQLASDGSLYLAFETPVVFPLLSSVGLRLFGLVGIYVLPLLGGWLTAVIAGVLAAAISPGAGAWAVLLVGLATPVWFYSVLFWEHTLATCLVLLAVAVAAFSRRRGIAALLAAVLLCIAAASMRMEILALGAALAITWVIRARLDRRGSAAPGQSGALRSARWRRVTILALVAIMLGIAAFLHAALTVRHLALLSQLPARLQFGIETLWASPWSILDVFIHIAIHEAPPVSDAWVLAAGIGVVLCLIAAFVRNVSLEGILLVAGFGLVSAFSISLLTFPEVYRALHGFIPVAPFVVVAPYAWHQADGESRRDVLAFLLVLAAIYPVIGMLAISTIYLEAGRLAVAMEWGQRYLLTLYALAGVLAVVAVRSHWRSARPLWLRRLFAGGFALLVATAFALEIRGNGMLYFTRVRLASWEDVMRREGPLVTDVWWLPASFAVLYTEHEMYYVGRQHMGGWASRAVSHGVRGFTFVGVKPIDVRQFRSDSIRTAPTQPPPLDGLYAERFVINPAGDPTSQSLN